MSYKAKQRYLDSRTDRLKLNIIPKDATNLPNRFRNWKAFKSSFGEGNYYSTKFCGYDIVVNLSYAYEHFQRNTHSENRESINAVIKPILADPLIVIKDSYKDKNTLTFYKAFKNNDKLHHILLFKLYEDSDGQYKFKTVYDVHENLSKIKRIIKANERDTVYFKY